MYILLLKPLQKKKKLHQALQKSALNCDTDGKSVTYVFFRKTGYFRGCADD